MASERVSDLMDSYYVLGRTSPKLEKKTEEIFVDFSKVDEPQLKILKDRVSKDIRFLEERLEEIRLRNYVIVSEEVDRVALIDWLENKGAQHAESAASSVCVAVDEMKSICLISGSVAKTVRARSIADRLESLQELPRKIKRLLFEGKRDKAISLIEKALKLRKLHSVSNSFKIIHSVLDEIYSISMELVDIELQNLEKKNFTDFPTSFIPALIGVLSEKEVQQIKSRCMALVIRLIEERLEKVLERFEKDRMTFDEYIADVEPSVTDCLNFLKWTWPNGDSEIHEAEKRVRNLLIPGAIFSRCLIHMTIDQLDQGEYIRLFDDSETSPSRFQVQERGFINTVKPIFCDFVANNTSSLGECASRMCAIFAERALRHSKTTEAQEELSVFKSAVEKILLEYATESTTQVENILNLLFLEKFFNEKSLPNLERLVGGEMVADIYSSYTIESSKIWMAFVDRKLDMAQSELESSEDFVSFTKEFLENVMQQVKGVYVDKRSTELSILTRLLENQKLQGRITVKISDKIRDLFPCREIEAVLARIQQTPYP